MKLRFKLRTLLIATTLFAVFLGLQVHIHRKAKKFVEAGNEMSEASKQRMLEDAGLKDGWKFVGANDEFRHADHVQCTFWDFVLCRRRVRIEFSAMWIPKSYDDPSTICDFDNVYTFSFMDESLESNVVNERSFRFPGRGFLKEHGVDSDN